MQRKAAGWALRKRLKHDWSDPEVELAPEKQIIYTQEIERLISLVLKTYRFGEEEAIEALRNGTVMDNLELLIIAQEMRDAIKGAL